MVDQQPPKDEKSSRRNLYDYSQPTQSHWYSGRSDPLDQVKHQRPTTQQQRRASVPSPYPQRSSRTRSRIQQRQRATENWAWVIIAVALLGMTLLMTMILIFVLRSDNNDKNAVALNEPLIEPTSIIYSGVEGEEVRGALDGNSMVIEPWDGNERFTVLLMGLDGRPGEANAQCRTDTMMVISIDPVHDRIGILSIPRDTYVEVPGYQGLRRINEACPLGNLYLPGNGPKLAMQTVQYNFGIRINDYIMVNFDTFIKIVDRIGGVDVEVTRTIDDPTYPDMYYGYDSFHIEAGLQHLDGITALKYARSRHGSDDIDRGRRQQQIIFAVRDKVLSADMVDDLLAQSLPIWNDLDEGIDTGLSLEQLVRLALYAKDVPAENIKNAVVDWNYLRSYRTETGADVVVPERNNLIPLMLEVFGEGYNQ
ncbi:MAG: LCP family protein [Anaerolineales bacterium]|nr:LCP family protein [Anaerolineales bacterium]